MCARRYTDLDTLTDEEFQTILNAAPSHDLEKTGLFRLLGKNAVISYPEYLFLVSILRSLIMISTKSHVEYLGKRSHLNSYHNRSDNLSLTQTITLNKNPTLRYSFV